jgi:hypothetical protein
MDTANEIQKLSDQESRNGRWHSLVVAPEVVMEFTSPKYILYETQTNNITSASASFSTFGYRSVERDSPWKAFMAKLRSIHPPYTELALSASVKVAGGGGGGRQGKVQPTYRDRVVYVDFEGSKGSSEWIVYVCLDDTSSTAANGVCAIDCKKEIFWQGLPAELM